MLNISVLVNYSCQEMWCSQSPGRCHDAQPHTGSWESPVWPHAMVLLARHHLCVSLHKILKPFMLKTIVHLWIFGNPEHAKFHHVVWKRVLEWMHKWNWGYDFGFSVAYNFLSLLRRKNELGEGRASKSTIAILSMDFHYELFQYKAHTRNLELTGTHCMPPDDSDKWTHFRMGGNMCVSRSCRDDNEKVHSKWWMVRCECHELPSSRDR